MSADFTPGANTRASQRAAILAALQQKPLSTIVARESLSVLHPAGRIMELRRAGHAIATLSQVVYDAAGQPHRSALYVLGVAP